MFLLALLLGIYAYLLFFLGIMGWLYKPTVMIITIIFWFGVLFWQKKSLVKFIHTFSLWKEIANNKILFFLISLVFIQAGINLIGALGPELSFDALWYHLTIPKLWLVNHEIFFIPGGLLYYSAMPKLGELLFLPGLAFGNEILVKFIHFSFVLFCCLALYKLQRKFFTPVISLIGIVIFYSNLVVAWESTTAYVDLVRTFFEVLALWGFINWWENRKRKWLIISAMMVGLAITTKLLALGSLVVFCILFFYLYFSTKKIFDLLTCLFTFVFIALLIPLPWFLFAYIHTGNPAYPFFSELYQVAPEPISLINFLEEIWSIFTKAADPISPIYLIFLPLIIYFFLRPRVKPEIKIIGIYSLFSIIVWYFTPRTGGGRFLMPYLPALSILCAWVYAEILQRKESLDQYYKKLLLGLIIVLAVISIGYRFAANIKYLPVIIGLESKDTFLSTHLNFSYGDFYDTDAYLKNTITENDKLLLVGFHNLYYVDVPFIDASWVKPRDFYNYIATQNTELPKEYKDWQLIYTNPKTMIKLYRKQK